MKDSLRDGEGSGATTRREGFDARVSSISALGEPARRALYRYVVVQPSPVSREEAAAGVGVARHIAKFHLDKLADDGLLEVEFRRPPGRGGPGAGRPTKLYRRSGRELEVSLPDRRYDLAGRLLARAITDAEHLDVPVIAALADAARDTGQSLGELAAARAGSKPTGRALAGELNDVLEELGYDPRAEPDGISLANCPFHALSADYTDLVCGMNLELISGVLSGMGAVGLHARLEPCETMCCVRLRQVQSTSSL
jgi:predicted ArsR family transcriptional regulator